MEHKELISELSLYKERLELTLNGTNCGTWYHDFDANMIHYDERAKQLLGIEKSSVHYEDWFSFIHPDDVGRVSKTIKEKLDLKEPHVNIIYRVIIDNTIRHLKVNSVVKYQGNRPDMSYGLIQDVTDMINSEIELKRLNKELQKALLEIKTLKVLYLYAPIVIKYEMRKGHGLYWKNILQITHMPSSLIVSVQNVLR